MATHRSAEKRDRQNKQRNLRKSAVKSNVKTKIKAVLAAVEDKDLEGAKSALAEAIPAIDKAAAKGAFHKNTASRRVSRLTRKVKSLLSSES